MADHQMPAAEVLHAITVDDTHLGKNHFAIICPVPFAKRIEYP